MISVHEARRDAAARLSAAGIEQPALDARVLLAHALGVNSTQLLMRDADMLPPEAGDRFNDLVAQRETGVPVAYLVGEREFMGLSFVTTAQVLVPRPDTEPLVEWGLAWLNRHEDATVADIGTGTGAIAVSIARYAARPTTVVATDISEEALAICRQNADALLSGERRDRFQARLGSLTEPLDAPVDLLLTNLPYLTPAQIAENPALNHEPRLALDGGDDGLDMVRAVIADLPRILALQGAVGCEIDPSQASLVSRLLGEALTGHEVTIVPDLAGDARHVVASFPQP